MTEDWQAPERYSLRKTVFLHLAPGIPYTLAFPFVAWVVNRTGGPTYLALILCIPLLLVCEVGILVVVRKQIHWSWKSILVPRGNRRVSILDILVSVAVIYTIAEVASVVAIPSRMAILRVMTNWLPPWVIFTGISQGITPNTLWLGLFLSGFTASIVEELYYRAFLLPRIPVYGRWAPAVNAALHSFCHFYTPWNYLVFFLAFLPLAYYVRLRGNIVPTIITHILFNSVGVVLLLTGQRLSFN